MKAYLLIFFSAFLFYAPLSHAYDIEDHADEYMFVDDLDIVRGFIWGLTPDMIMQEEKATFVGREMADDESRLILFIDKIFDVRHTIGYEFDENNKLWRVKLFNEKKYHNPQDRMEDLLTLQNYLIERYGAPIAENFYWKNNEQFNKVENWGWALYRGNLAVEIIWQTDEANIIISLKATEPLDPKFTIAFEDIDKVKALDLIDIEAQTLQPPTPSIEVIE